MRSLLIGSLFASLSIHAARVPWVDSKFHSTPEPPPAYKLKRVFHNLTFTNPVELTWVPELKRFMMVELGTKIHLFENKAGVMETALLLELGNSTGSTLMSCVCRRIDSGGSFFPPSTTLPCH